MRVTNSLPARLLGVSIALVVVLSAGAALDRVARGQTDAGRDGGWEYKQETSVPATDSEILDEEVLEEQRKMLLANGRDGWELACTHTFPLSGQGGGGGQMSFGVVYVFKRPLR